MARHRTKRTHLIALLLAIAAALGWSTVSLPGWANDDAPTAKANPQRRSPQPLSCDQQDSPDKGWYQAVYVHRAGNSPRPGAAKHIRQVLWNIDQIFEASARRFGKKDSRRLRLIQDSSCQAKVIILPVSGLPATLPDFAASHKAADAAIAKKADQMSDEDQERFKRTRILYFFDTGVPKCGVGSTPGPKGRANLHTGTAAVSWKCANDGALSHEMIHQFGVTHCDERKDQGNDPICRKYDKTPRCNDILAPVVLDCTKDEFAYFSPRPAPRSALAKRPGENAANSPYLIKNDPAPPVDARLVSTRTAECLGVGGAHEAIHQTCKDNDTHTWRRTIDDQGFLTLEHRASGKCLAAPAKSAPSTQTAVRVESCAPKASRQQWWMSPTESAADEYLLVNRSTGQRLQVPGSAGAPGRVLQAATGGTAVIFRMEGAPQ
ncbi:RICIN domain-containing protein [Streptomyces decoyicus]|uniref:RICIN domain-containing protein n=1 Tax=Streptomyces decoyicus TaxID=249567 RepID=UPI0036675BA4